MKIEKLTPGQVVYDAHSHRMGNTTMRTMGCWSVFIVAVDVEKQAVTARWNGNPPQKFYSRSWSKWREKEPVFITTGYHKRLATRAELKAMKEQPAA